MEDISAAYKEYNRACEKAMEDKHVSLEEYQGALILGQGEYEEAMSWADGFWERRQKEKDAARKAARLQRLQRRLLPSPRWLMLSQ